MVQQLSYDPAGRLSSWQNQPTSPTSTANYLYDGSGNRVAMLTTVNGTSTLTAYIGSIEEVQTTGSTTTITTYYAVDGMRIAANVNGTFDYFGYDALGSQVVVLNNSGALIGSQLYGPYGNLCSSSGTLPTSIGFTGQQTDSVTGLDYFNARYYDPLTGQFVSADVVQGNAQGTSPYMYVMGNPETRTDPTGQMITCGSCGSSGPPNANDCAADPSLSGCSTPASQGDDWEHDPGIKPTHQGGSSKKNKGDNWANGVNEGCGNLSQQKCDEEKGKRNGEVGWYKQLIAYAQLGIGFISLIFDLIDAFKDFSKDIIKAVGDILSVFGDIGSILSGIAAAFHINGLNVAADAIGTITNALAGAYKIANNTWWGIWALKGAVGFAVKIFADANLPELLLSISVVFLEHALNMDIIQGVKGAVLGFAKAALSGLQWHVDQIDNENLQQYCGC